MGGLQTKKIFWAGGRGNRSGGGQSSSRLIKTYFERGVFLGQKKLFFFPTGPPKKYINTTNFVIAPGTLGIF